MSFAKYLRTIKSNKIKIKHDGHAKFSYSVLNNLTKKHNKIITCTILRNPISHSMSLWSYLVKHKEHYGHSKANNLSFIEWCRNFKEFPYYTKFFGNNDIGKSIKIIKEIDFVLRTENLTNDINKMLQKLNLKPNFGISINGTSKRAPTKIEADVIRQVRQDDFTLLKLLQQ